jgi:SAM-dependent methyltransferase
MDAQYWDERYRSQEQLFSGEPNPLLVSEVTGLPPGQALDVGCGEGADAIWLARHGWQVTAVDISRTALQRAAAAAADVTGRIAWARADLTATPPPAAAFDLVSVQYFPLPHRPDHTGLRALLSAVAPGGTLLFVSHDLAGMPPRPDFDPADYYQPAEIAELLDESWSVQINETRPRSVPGHHTHDTILRAQYRQ